MVVFWERETVLQMIISGGQSGVDRAGLEAAKKLGIKTGGYAPRGYKTENGPDLSLKELGLIDTYSSNYAVRTEMNAAISDGTLIFGNTKSSGSRLTINVCQHYRKKWQDNPTPKQIREFLIVNNIRTLNVAGNRESKNPGIYELVYGLLMEALR